MTFSKKQKMIIWITTFFVVIFIGFKKLDVSDYSSDGTLVGYTSGLEFYGMRLFVTHTNFGIYPYTKTETFQMGLMQTRGLIPRILIRMGGHKYGLIVATLLIGLAGVLTAGKKAKKE
jgi:hypothetical protein